MTLDLRKWFSSDDFDLDQILVHGLDGKPTFDPSDEKLRAFVPGILQINPANPSPISDAFGYPTNTYRVFLNIERRLAQICLYADEVFFPEGIDRRNWDKNPTRGPEKIAEKVLGVSYIGRAVHDSWEDVLRRGEGRSWAKRQYNLARQGVLRLYNSRKVFESFAPTLLNGKTCYSDQQRANWWPGWFVAEALAYADHFGVPYTAIHEDELRVLELAKVELRGHLKAESDLLVGLSRLEVPGISTDPETIVKARADTEGFEAFRGQLRVLFGHMRERLGDEDFDRDLKRIEKDHLAPALAELNSELNRNRGLKDHIRTNGITLTVSAMLALATQNPTLLVPAGLSATARFLLQRLVDKNSPSHAARFFNHIKVQ